jgi:hypothetical protein
MRELFLNPSDIFTGRVARRAFGQGAKVELRHIIPHPNDVRGSMVQGLRMSDSLSR